MIGYSVSTAPEDYTLTARDIVNACVYLFKSIVTQPGVLLKKLPTAEYDKLVQSRYGDPVEHAEKALLDTTCPIKPV